MLSKQKVIDFISEHDRYSESKNLPFFVNIYYIDLDEKIDVISAFFLSYCEYERWVIDRLKPIREANLDYYVTLNGIHEINSEHFYERLSD